PHATAGSLVPAFAPARHVCLTVKHPCALTLDTWLPTRLREPLGASVTFWEATAPVKLPTRHCPLSRSGTALELRSNQAGIPRLAPPELASELHSLPAILYKLDPNPMPSCSKAPRVLSVLPRVTGILADIAFSPSL